MSTAFGAYAALLILLCFSTVHVKELYKVNFPQDLEPIRMVYASIMVPDGHFGGVISYNYSYPMIYFDENGYRTHINTTHTKESDEISFLFGHEELLKRMKEKLTFNESISIRYECQYERHIVWCVVYYLKDHDPIAIASYIGKPDRDNPKTISYCPSCFNLEVVEEEGKVIEDIIPTERNRWKLLRNFYDNYIQWSIYNKMLKAYSSPQELAVTIAVTETDTPIVMCIVSSSLPIPFNLTLSVPGFESVFNQSEQNSDKVSCSVAGFIKFEKEINMTCEVSSQMGWTYYVRRLLTRGLNDTNKIKINNLPDITSKQSKRDIFSEVMDYKIKEEKCKGGRRSDNENADNTSPVQKSTWDIEIVTLISFALLCLIIIFVLSQRTRSPFSKRRRRLRRED